MASYTPNYNLKKPAGTDMVDIDDLNGNMDIIDTQMNSLNSKITKQSSFITDTDAGTAINEIIYNGLMVCINFTSASKTWSEGDQLGVVPSGMRPVTRVIITGSTYGSNIGVQVKIATDGKITYESQTGLTGRISFLATYMLY